MPALPAFADRDARIELMDQQGIEACAMFSTAVSTEHRIEEAEVLYAHLRALNRWVEDEWGYAYQDRIFCPASISLRDLDMAIAELDRVIRERARPQPATGTRLRPLRGRPLLRSLLGANQ
jgi:hypothetical protein